MSQTGGFTATVALEQGALGPVPASNEDESLELPGFAALYRPEGPAQVGRDASGSVTAVVAGEVLESDAETLARDYAVRGERALTRLDGSFALLVVDRRAPALVVATDVVKSRRVFVARLGDCAVIATSLQAVPLSERPIDRSAVICALANGAVLNDRTLFEGVRSLGAGTVLVLDRDGARESRYWSPSFAADAPLPEGEIDVRMGELLIDAVRRRLPHNETMSLSLSGGLDARGLLGVLAEKLGARDVDCFSYARPDPPGGSDARVAARLASRYGYPHAIVPSYRGDVARVIERNAALGRGIANVCEEVDAWDALDDGGGERAVFVGDECFGWPGVALRSADDILRAVDIRAWRSISWLQQFLPPSVAFELGERLDAEVASMLARAPRTGDRQDVEDFLYFEQRVVNVLMPWRELFSSLAGRVVFPWLDRRLLELVDRLPSRERRGRTLYHRVAAGLLRDLFAVPPATRSGYLVNWDAELARRRGELLERLRRPSRLDEVVPVDVAERLLERRGTPAAARAHAAKKAIDFAVSRPERLGRVAWSALAERSLRVDEATLLLRLLVQREFLALDRQRAAA